MDLSFSHLLCVSAKQNLNIKQFLFRLFYSDIFIVDIMNVASVCLVDRKCGTAHISFVLAVDDITVFEYQIMNLTLESITKLYGVTWFCIPDHVIVNAHFCYIPYCGRILKQSLGFDADTVICGTDKAVFHLHILAAGDINSVSCYDS